MGFAAAPALAQSLVDLHLPGGNGERPTIGDFPGKGRMILQRTRPPLLETPMQVFDQDVFTPNDQFFVRWHWADIPTAVDVDSFRLNVFGHVRRPLSIKLAELMKLPRVEIAAVNQCSGNSRGLFQPRDVLDIAGVAPGRCRCASAGSTGRWCRPAPISSSRSTWITRATAKS